VRSCACFVESGRFRCQSFPPAAGVPLCLPAGSVKGGLDVLSRGTAGVGVWLPGADIPGTSMSPGHPIRQVRLPYGIGLLCVVYKAPGRHTPTPAVPRDRTSRPPFTDPAGRQSGIPAQEGTTGNGTWGYGMADGLEGIRRGVYGKLIFFGVLFWGWVWYK